MKKSAEGKFVQDVKEKLCYVAFDYDTKLTSTAETDKDKTYLFPHGSVITVGAERFRCKCCSSRVPESTTLLSSASWSVTFALARICTPMPSR